ncbi:hypothetical protein K7432_013157 [Basidiobolus ranarum]|uniref:Uncharacterized protein n=1 Tax=Basidiobolus ranarum TaxID=34480 RepID=A0ABR2VRD3_9FUNG
MITPKLIEQLSAPNYEIATPIVDIESKAKILKFTDYSKYGFLSLFLLRALILLDKPVSLQG